MWARSGIFRGALAGLAATGGLLLAGCSAGMHAHAGDARYDDVHGAAVRGEAAGELEAAFEQAMGLIDELRFARALAKLTQLEPTVAAAGRVELAAECVFWRGFCQEKLSRPAEAAALYRRVLEDYAETRVSAPARRRLASLGSSGPPGP